MFHWMLENSLVVLALSAVALPLCALLRSKPALCHVLWLVILVRLVLPPVPLESPAVVRGFVSSAAQSLGSLVDEGVFPGNSGVVHTLQDSSIDPLASKPMGLAASGSPGAPLALAPTETWLNPDTVRLAALCLWIVGALAVLVVQLRRCARLQRLVSSTRAAPASMQRTVSYMAKVLGIRPPEVRLLNGLGSPVIWSLGRPLFLWPARGERTKASRCINGIVAHELAHIRRHDHWVAWFELAAMTVCWWNPVFWFVRRRLRLHAEEACDAWAVWALPSSRRAYAEALIDVAERNGAPITRAPVLGASESGPRYFQRRLSLIMEREVTHRASPLAAGLAMAAALILLPGASKTATPHADALPVATDDRSTPNAAEIVPSNNFRASPEKSAHAVIPARLLPFLEAEELAWSADTHFQNGHWAQAASLYTRMAEAQPDEGRLLRRLGHALLELGRDEQALPVFERQLALGVERADAEARIAAIHAARGDLEAALTHLEAAVQAGFGNLEALADDRRLEPLRTHEPLAFESLVEYARRTQALTQEGEDAIANEQWEQAAAAYRQAKTLSPQMGLATLMLGYSLIGGGRHEEAVGVCTEQIELGFSVSIGRYNTACALSRLGHLERSMDALEAAIESGFERWEMLTTDPDLEALRQSPRMRELLAEVTRRSALWNTAREAQDAGHWDTAAETWRALAADARPGGKEHLLLARSLSRAGDPEAAIAILEQFVPHAQQVMNEALFQLAGSHALSGHHDLALGYLEWAARTGFTDSARLRSDERLVELRVSHRFELMLQAVQRRDPEQSRLAQDAKA